MDCVPVGVVSTAAFWIPVSPEERPWRLLMTKTLHDGRGIGSEVPK
jgi:hypothetical protein